MIEDGQDDWLGDHNDVGQDPWSVVVAEPEDDIEKGPVFMPQVELVQTSEVEQWRKTFGPSLLAVFHAENFEEAGVVEELFITDPLNVEQYSHQSAVAAVVDRYREIEDVE